MTASFTENMAKLILISEESDSRFEKFCCDLFYEVDGILYLPTSQNYDQGRDGRTSDLRSGSKSAILCATLRKDPIKKASEDVEKIKSKPFLPCIIRSCVLLNKDKHGDETERLLDQIKATFSTIDGVKTVLVDGIIQIAAYAVKYPGIFEKYYRSELDNLRRALSVSSDEDDRVGLTGMRIALTTQFSNDALALRDDLLRNLILSALSSGSLSINSICKKVSDSLRLPKGIYPEYFQAVLEGLIEEAVLVRVDNKYSITDKGRKEITHRTNEGAACLINGQQLIHDLIHNLTGARLEPACFSRVWSIVQDEISNLFLTNGIYIVQSIESIISNESKIGDHEELNESVHRLAQKIAELDMWGNEKETILQAMIDLFHENKSEAFAWLSQLGATYVSLCSLGLEPSAQKEVVNRLQDLDLLLDTDLVLAFLCSGEVKHDAVRSVVKTWQRITGNIYVTPCVMEETAYHAWISSNDYDSVWRDLGKYNENDAHHLINNAFVRAFRVESKGRYAPKYWNYYISQFKGTHEYDYSKIEKILQDEHIFLIASKNIDEGFAKTIQDSLIENQLSKDKSIREIDAEELDKYRRDGLLIATLLKQRSLRNTLIVSSSTKLCDICRNHKDVLGRLEPVAPIGAIAYLLTMIPGTNMNLGTLKGILFDTGFADKIKGVERVGLRVLRASEEYLMPFARRATLRRKLDEKIRDLATQIGRRPSDVLDDFEHCKLPSDVTANIIASAVDEIASSKSEKKIWELEQKIKDIEKKRR